MMAMSSKDYEAVAAAVAATGGDYATREELACRLAAVFAGENSRFDLGRFLVACGFDS